MQYQQKFIDIIKSIAPSNLSLAHELSQELGVSIDSAYRRLRCETPITLEEAVKICYRFDVPLESLNSGIPEVVTCHYHLMYKNEDSLQTYLDELHKQVTTISKDKQAAIHYAAEDIPVFYHFAYPELLRFKLFYWRKSILNHASLLQMCFEDFDIDEQIAKRCQEIYEAYQKTASSEIWTEQTVMSTIQQIRFYWDAGFFRDKTSATQLCQSLRSMFSEIKAQADVGMKRSSHSFNGVSYALYQSDLMIGNNGVVVEFSNRKAVFLGYLSFNFIRSENKDFGEQNKIWMDHLKAKSTLISAVSEKQRNMFFKGLNRHIETLQDYIMQDA
ncbi:MAG: hypothetical protein ACK4GL_11510 [Flavobacteriales bacterium]